MSNNHLLTIKGQRPQSVFWPVFRCVVSLFQRVADQSGLEVGGEAGVGRLCVPGTVRYVWQKLSYREGKARLCVCFFVLGVLCDPRLFTTAVIADQYHD